MSTAPHLAALDGEQTKLLSALLVELAGALYDTLEKASPYQPTKFLDRLQRSINDRGVALAPELYPETD